METRDQIPAESWAQRFHRWNAALNDRFFGPFAGYQKYYRALVRDRLRPHTVVVDLGCGTVNIESWLQTPVTVLLVACDYSVNSLRQHTGHNRIAADVARLPFRSSSVDLLVADNLLEHLSVPAAFLEECHRVLKPGGSVVFATPNRYSYVSLAASITPTALHRWFKRVQSASNNVLIDTTDTCYRINSLDVLRKQPLAFGFEIRHLDAYVGAPCYSLCFAPPFHLLFIFLHRLLEAVGGLRRWFGISIIANFEKPASHAVTAAEPASLEAR